MRSETAYLEVGMLPAKQSKKMEAQQRICASRRFGFVKTDVASVFFLTFQPPAVFGACPLAASSMATPLPQILWVPSHPCHPSLHARPFPIECTQFVDAPSQIASMGPACRLWVFNHSTFLERRCATKNNNKKELSQAASWSTCSSGWRPVRGYLC